MLKRVTLLPGLPATGPMATPFASDWGRLGREGTVVEFETDRSTWVGNFEPGLWGLTAVHPHGDRAIVLARGDVWIVDPEQRSGECVLPVVDDLLEVDDPKGWIFSRQGLALARIGPAGLVWHTRRISWDGLADLRVVGGKVIGTAYSHIDDGWHPFSVDLRTGRASGGSYLEDDGWGWERIADQRGRSRSS
jgi:hypothetical protein